MPATLEITLVDVGRACAPLGGMAVYVWHCDAEGIYSIYAAEDRNYLRGVGITDDQGRVRFTTVFPASEFLITMRCLQSSAARCS